MKLETRAINFWQAARSFNARGRENLMFDPAGYLSMWVATVYLNQVADHCDDERFRARALSVLHREPLENLIGR